MSEQSVQPRHQQLIMTIYGLYAREEGGAIPVAALIRMLGDLGIEEAGVRSSVSRMKRRGTLESRRGSGVAEYALSARSLEIIVEGDARIYSRQRANATDPWLLIVFSVPEAERGKRHTLRSQLTRMGFGAVSPGVWIAPASLFSETKNRLHRLGLAPYVDLFSVDHLTPEQLGDKINQWWDLDSLDRLYREFVEKYEPLQEKWRRVGRGLRRLRCGRPHSATTSTCSLPGGGCRFWTLVYRRNSCRKTGVDSWRSGSSPRFTSHWGRWRASTCRDHSPSMTATPWISMRASFCHSRVTPIPAIAG